MSRFAVSDEPYQGSENKELVDQGLASIEAIASMQCFFRISIPLENIRVDRRMLRTKVDCFLSAVRARTRDHRDATVRRFDGYSKTNFMLGMAERRAFPGGPAGTEAG